MNDKQKENWITSDEISNIYNEYKTTCESLYKKSKLTNTDYQTIQSFIILSLLGGIFIPPRRSKDYCDFKIKNIDPKTDNYLDKNSLVFNSYKTAKCYGEQKIIIPVPLKNILKKWISKNPTDYLLFDSNFNKLTSVKMNQRLNKIFEGKMNQTANKSSQKNDSAPVSTPPVRPTRTPEASNNPSLDDLFRDIIDTSVYTLR
jgi:hypothetical protein